MTTRPCPSVNLISLGCKVNQVEGEEIVRRLEAAGWRRVETDADVCIVNTCTVTAEADRKSRKLIRKLIREHPSARVVVTGCYAETGAEAVAAIPGVALVIPQRHKDDAAARIAQLLGQLCPRAAVVPEMAARERTFVKVQDGCRHFCSYCIVPFARSVVSSKSVEEVVREIAAAAEGGAQEVVLTGIRLGAYGGETGETLAGLLHALREIKVARLRLSSLDPGDLNEDLIREMADHPRLCRHLHLPLQSGDDHILTLMNRGYTSGDFIAWVARWREVWPDVALTTDVMVGFPGETEAAFQRTCQVVEETGCSRLHVFAYSRRPGTAAAALPDQVAESIKAARSRELIALGKTLFRHYAEPLVGREVEVLFEQRDPATGAWEGLTESYVRVLAADARDWSGRFARVRVDDVARDHVTGSIVA